MYNQNKNQLEYKKFRVRGNIKSFRDLEIYKQTTLLASQLMQLNLLEKLKNNSTVVGEIEKTLTNSLKTPALIAQSYGEKFVDKKKAYNDLENASKNIAQTITKLDFTNMLITDNELKQKIIKIINQYQIQKRKILNLKNAWIRTEEKWNKTPQQ